MYGINPCSPGSNNLDYGNYFFYCSQCDNIVKTKEVPLVVCDPFSSEPKYKITVLRCLRHELDGFQFGDKITTLYALAHDSKNGEVLYHKLIDQYYSVRILDISTTCLGILGSLMCAVGILLSCVFTSLVIGLPAWFLGLIIGGIGVVFVLSSVISGAIADRKVREWRRLSEEYMSLCSLRPIYDDFRYHMVNHYPPVCSSTVETPSKVVVNKSDISLGVMVSIPSFMLAEFNRLLNEGVVSEEEVESPGKYSP